MTAGTKKAWHIYHYRELFRARDAHGDDIQMVQYSQRPVIGHNEYAEQWLEQMGTLKRSMPLADFAMIKHVFEELLDHSQRLNKGHLYLRGFILNEKLEPASTAWIAAKVGVKPEEMKGYLVKLERVGLVEKMDIPSEPAPSNSPRPPSKPLFKTGKYNRVTGNREKRKINKPGKKNNPEQKRNQLDAEVELMMNQKPEGGANLEGKVKTQTTASPPSAPNAINPDPGNPVEPDGGGGEKNNTLLKPGRLDGLCDSTGYAFADAVYSELEIQPTADSNQSSELGSFQSAWQRAMTAGLKVTELNRLWEGALKDASEIKKQLRRGGQIDRPPAVLMSRFNKRLAAVKKSVA